VGFDAKNVGRIPFLVLVGNSWFAYTLGAGRTLLLPLLLGLYNCIFGNVEEGFHAFFKVLCCFRPFYILRLFHVNRVALAKFTFAQLLLVLIALLDLSVNVKKEVPSEEPRGTSQTEINGTFNGFLVEKSCPRDANENQGNSKRYPSKNNKEQTMKPEWITACVTIVYTVVSFFALLAIRRQSRNAVLVERAWIDLVMNGENISTCPLHVTNHGKTIAIITSWKVAPVAVNFKGTLENPPERPEQMLTRNSVNRMVTPGATEFLEFLPVAEFFSSDWSEILGLTKKAYFFVSITYRDTTGEDRRTDACYYYSFNRTFADMPERRRWT